MADIDKLVEVNRKEYLTLLAPLVEKVGVSPHDVLSATMDHSGLEVTYVDRHGVNECTATRRTARIHVFDPVVF